MANKMTLAEMQRAVWDLVNGAPIVQPNQEGSPPVVRQVLQPRQIASVIKTTYYDVARLLREDQELVNLFQKKTAEFVLAGDVTELTDTFATSIMDAFGSPPSNPTVSGTYSGSANAYWVIDITASGTPDVFEWAKNNGSATTGVNITGGAQLLSDGISITFPSTTAYTVGQAWVLSVARYPTDMIRPYLMNETEMAVDGGEGFSSPALRNNGNRTLMTDNPDFLPRESESTRQLWNWRNQEIVFNDATQPCKYNLLYEYQVTAPTLPADTLQIYDIEQGVIYGAVARILGSDQFERMSKLEIERIIKNEKARRAQSTGTYGTQ
ncbi:MAG: hypothetical protein IPK52_21995 [Chloroflexi bacterium]|nr:hypothetical protein [Chloroflexota bacterium]